MRRVYADRDAANARGAIARADLEAGFGEAAVGRLIRARLDVIAGRIGASTASTPAPAAVPAQREHTRDSYAQLADRVRSAIASTVPAGATVAVVSRGDDALLAVDGRPARHFPANAEGTWAGYHPADSDAAVAHLHAQRARGAEFLVFPQTAYWWLDHYAGLKAHLDRTCPLVSGSTDTCMIFDLRGMPANGRAAAVSTASAAVNPTAEAPMSVPPFSGPIPPTRLGVNVAGHLASEKGVGEGVRSDVRALLAAGVDIALNDVVDPGSLNAQPILDDVSDARVTLSAANPHPINLIHLNGDEIERFARDRGPDYFRGRYNVGYWAWELGDFPPQWQSAFEPFDEIWVPSDFALSAVSRASPVPVVKMPHALNVAPLGPPRRRPAGPFTFLFMFDFHSSLERKNPVGLIAAYRRAFGSKGAARGGARLVIKCSHGDAEGLGRLRRAARGLNVTFVDAVLPRAQVDALVDDCDCYVSLHRGEGFGLTLAEAMARGKPVIATGYSGNMDFMRPGNSYPVPYTLVEVGHDDGSYRRGSAWADPDLSAAAALMRQVAADPAKARAVGRRAHADVAAAFDPAVVGGLMRRRLERAALPRLAKASVPPPATVATGPAVAPEPYAQLVARVRLAVRPTPRCGRCAGARRRPWRAAGKIWPGWTRSRGLRFGVGEQADGLGAVLGADAGGDVVAVASTDTVKSVLKLSRLSSTMRLRPSFAARSLVIGAQIRPRPKRIMKLMLFGGRLSRRRGRGRPRFRDQRHRRR